ncbi:rho GTPase-activating protein 22 isoform X9 [Rousettus aegyptiacus]|uniref:rho GTPase-activating protein 22 isoform X9 n=1 Tax=Rousettus aegyptiacus TaxID=9407 RepID=UPI00168D50FC|nr:rho GTPase-activating protein 22 isoform X9 [Rousettus aegyptiacus]
MLPTASSKRRTFAAKYFARSKSLVMGEQSRSPGRLSCPQKLGPVLKAGWLKKQRSIMKNWQQRWFVLCGDQLFYYKDKDETKPQVVLGSGRRCRPTLRRSCLWPTPSVTWRTGCRPSAGSSGPRLVEGSLGSAWRTRFTKSENMAPAWPPCWWSSVWTSSESVGSLRKGSSACRARPTW